VERLKQLHLGKGEMPCLEALQAFLACQEMVGKRETVVLEVQGLAAVAAVVAVAVVAVVVAYVPFPMNT